MRISGDSVLIAILYLPAQLCSARLLYNVNLYRAIGNQRYSAHGAIHFFEQPPEQRSSMPEARQSLRNHLALIALVIFL